MNLNSFKRNRKALTALLICTGFIAAHPLAAFAEENVPAVQMVQQQKQSVSGVVKDSTGEPVIGANIREKGNPSNGTITDIDGNFSIKVNPDATLEISFIGYKTVEVKAGLFRCKITFPPFMVLPIHSTPKQTKCFYLFCKFFPNHKACRTASEFSWNQ